MARPETDTPARQALKDWISSKGRGAQSELATRLGVTEQLVNQWRSGSCRPGQVYRDALEVVTGIDPRDWETGKERDRRKRAMVGPEEPVVLVNAEQSKTGTDDANGKGN